MGEPFTTVQPPERASEGRLDSWKEIAAYLKRDVTTVQRWEKREGMPVHRHVHDKRGSVYALGSEIDEWLQKRRLNLEQEETSAAPGLVEPGAGVQRTAFRKRLWLALAGIAVVALLG